jgi:hypothetical protein
LAEVVRHAVTSHRQISGNAVTSAFTAIHTVLNRNQRRYHVNKLRINSALSWFSLHEYTEMHRQQNIQSADLHLRQLVFNQGQFDLTGVDSIISPTA